MKRKLLSYLLLYLCSYFLNAQNITTKQWQEDLNHFEKMVPLKHYNFFKKTSKQSFKTAIKSLRDKLPELSNIEMTIGLAKIISLAKDGHSWVDGYHPLFENNFKDGIKVKSVPIRIRYFEDGFYVYATEKGFKQYLGLQVTKVSDISITRALNLVSRVFPVENDMAKLSWGVYGLISPTILSAFGISDSSTEVVYTFSKDRKLFSVSLPVISKNPKIEGGFVNDSDWMTASNAGALNLQNAELAAWHTYLKSENLVYLKLNNFNKENIRNIRVEILSAINKSDKDEKTKLVIDVRSNYGGETYAADEFAKYILASKANKFNNLFVIIGRDTFSAAQLFSTALEKYSFAQFYGEPTGINIHFFGNSRNNVTLPNSQIKIYLATSWWQPTNMNDNRKWQAPNVNSPLTFSDYIHGRDPSLMAIINNIQIDDFSSIMNRHSSRSFNYDSFEHDVLRFKALTKNRYVNVEDRLNDFGYDLMEQKKYRQANKVFLLNTKLYPDSSNVFDSLVESYIELDFEKKR